MKHILSITKPILDVSTIINALLKEGVIENKKRVYLQPLQVSQYRIDARYKKVYRVLQNEKILFHLTVGPELKTLYEKSKQFYTACPSIVCKPLFFMAPDDTYNLFGREFVEGQSIEDLWKNNQITEDEIVETINILTAALETTFKNSTIQNAESELLAFQGRLYDLTIFNVMDKTFLDHVVFPFIREEMIKVPQRVRWSNGDFIERNIFLDDFGHAKLIDYEFATNTHFYNEDWIRIEKFSHLPVAVKSRLKNKTCIEKSWIELFFWLHQILYEQQIYVPQYCNEKYLIYINHIKKIILEHTSSHHQSVFFENTLQINEIAKSKYLAQLYVDTGLGLNEEQSITKIIRGNEQQIKFDLSRYENIIALRFDPLNERVALKLRQVKILTEGSTLCSQITYTTNALYHRDDLLIFDTNDPQVLIDTKDIIEPKTVIIQLDYLVWGLEVDKYINEEKSALITIKDEALFRQSEKLKSKYAELQRQAEELHIKDEALFRQSEELKNKDAELNRLSQELQAKYDELIRKAQEQQVKNAELLKLQAEILFLGDKMQLRDEIISELKEKLKNAQSLVNYFEHDSKVKEAIVISFNNTCIQELKEKHEMLSGMLNEKELAIETLQQDIEHLKNMNQSLEDQERQKDTFINVLENSLSLKLGRRIGGIVKAPMHIFEKVKKG